VYSLAAGGDNSAFKISGNQLVTNTNLDATMQQYYHIQVTSTEVSSGSSYTTTLTLIVTPAKNHAPYAITLSNNTILETAAIGSNVGQLVSYDADSNLRPETFTYSLGTSGANSAFTINGNELQIAATLNASVQQYYQIQVMSTEVSSGLSYSTTLTVIVQPVVIPPHSAISNNSIGDNASVGSIVGALTSYGDIGPFTYSLGTGGDNSAFAISGNNLVTSTILNALVQTYYHIQVTAVDQSGRTFTTPLTIVVTPSAHHAPYAITLTNNTIPDSTSIGSIVGSLNSYDVDSNNGPQSFTYALGGGGDNTAFAINGNQLVTNVVLNASLQQYYHIQVTSTEVGTGLSYTATLTIIVTPTQGHAPYAITLTNTAIPDTTPIQSTVGRLDSYDVDSSFGSQTFTYALGVGGDNNAFTISGNHLITNASFNASKQQYYHIQVTSTEVSSGLSFTTTLTIVVQPTAPTVINVSNSSISVDSSIGTLVGILTSTDQDSTTFTYSLATGGDNSAFKIVGNQLITNTNSPLNASYSIQITSKNQFGLLFTQSFSITTI
jgi:hypothetical protein